MLIKSTSPSGTSKVTPQLFLSNSSTKQTPMTNDFDIVEDSNKSFAPTFTTPLPLDHFDDPKCVEDVFNSVKPTDIILSSNPFANLLANSKSRQSNIQSLHLYTLVHMMYFLL